MKTIITYVEPLDNELVSLSSFFENFTYKPLNNSSDSIQTDEINSEKQKQFLKELQEIKQKKLIEQQEIEAYDLKMSETYWIKYEDDPNAYCSHSPKIKVYVLKTKEEIERCKKQKQELEAYIKLHHLDIPIDKRPFDKQSNLFIGSGGLGDALIVMNKFKSLHLTEYATIQWYTDQASTLNLVKELFELNNIPQTGQEKPYHYYGSVTNDIDKKISLHRNGCYTFTTAWNGDISQDVHALKSFRSDLISVSDILEVKGITPDTLINEPYYILQLDAGLIYHNQRKHWDNIELVLQLAQKINKKYNLKAVVIGNNFNISMPTEDFIDISTKGFQCIEYIKKAKFSLCLSGFIALCSLMSNIPTIIKEETPFITKRYYSHPKWLERSQFIDEISTSINSIVEYIDQTLNK